MKIGRNDACPCGSGKKYKRCCMQSAENLGSELIGDLSHILEMNPEMSIDELNVVAQHKMMQRNTMPLEEFCGLTPETMARWLYAPFDQITEVSINNDMDLSGSPVMQYLDIILDEAMSNGGRFKATAKGNLPAKLVKKASELRESLAIEKISTPVSISEYAGSNEDKFNALHYSRILAELAGVIYLNKGHFYVKKEAQKTYQEKGLQGLFLPMLEAAVKHYNWGYLDGWAEEPDLRLFWLFMVWRVREHGSLDKLIEEFRNAFPDFVSQMPAEGGYFIRDEEFIYIVQSRFIRRFLEFWGFASKYERSLLGKMNSSDKITIKPLLKQVFNFD